MKKNPMTRRLPEIEKSLLLPFTVQKTLRGHHIRAKIGKKAQGNPGDVTVFTTAKNSDINTLPSIDARRAFLDFAICTPRGHHNRANTGNIHQGKPGEVIRLIEMKKVEAREHPNIAIVMVLFFVWE